MEHRRPWHFNSADAAAAAANKVLVCFRSEAPMSCFRPPAGCFTIAKLYDSFHNCSTNRKCVIKFQIIGNVTPCDDRFSRFGSVASFRINCTDREILIDTSFPSASVDEMKVDDNEGGGDGGNGRSSGGGGDNREDADGDGDGDGDEREFGPVIRYDEVIEEAEKLGATLPADMLEAATSTGIRSLILSRYLDLQGSVWPLGFLMRHFPMLRNRMLADPSFLFKVGTEVVIDSCCATFAEVNKRGKDFWAEFELYAADLLVGIVVDIALVGMLAPYARIGPQSVSSGFLGHILHICGALPSSVFEAERPGIRFSLQQRIATFFYKGVLYGSVGFGCGIIGQGIANMIMNAKRSIKKSEEDIPVPPLVKSAALWGVFLAVSSNTRYQIVNGLEQIVEASPMAKRIPPVAMAFTVGVRFANNIYGGMQFVDWAKWSGVQ